MEDNQGEKCKIKRVIGRSSTISPLLLNVSNRALTAEELQDCECSWEEDEVQPFVRIVNFINNNKDDYQGTTNIKGNNISKTMLVLQNKKTNKVQLIEVSECSLERVQPKPSLQTNYDNDELQTTYEDNQSKLLKAFGSKKANRVSEMGLKMRINSDMMTSQIKHTAADVTVDVKELEQADSSVDTCLPPCHRDATDAAGVYRLEDFLTQSEMDSMEDEAFTILTLMPFTEEDTGYSQLFIDSLELLQNKLCEEKIKILLYAEALLRFINLRIKKLRRKEFIQNFPFPKELAKKIIDNFTVDGADSRIRNMTMEDKIVIHIIVLNIIACESCNTNLLSKYLPKFNVRKIQQIAQALCLTSRDKVTWFVKLPLPPPRSVFFRKRT